MVQNIVNQLRDALMPLIKESIAAADWNQDEWLTNHWGFDITDGDLCYEYKLYSRVGTPGKSLTRYHPYMPEPNPTRTEVASRAGSYYVKATYSGPTGAVLYSHGAFYNPAEGKSLEEWSRRFIIEAKMHVDGING